MPLSPEFVAQITEVLTAARPVQIKKMFGGLGIYLDEAFFGIADDDRLYFKVGPDSVAKYEAAGMGPWITPAFTNDKYREVPAAVVADAGELGEWVDEAAAVALATQKKPKKR